MTRSRGSMLPEKVRSLGSLFRRSSGSSTSSVTELHQSSPIPERPRRPTSARRSRSSLIVPRAQSTVSPQTVPEEVDEDTVQPQAGDCAPGPEAAGTQLLSSGTDSQSAQNRLSPLPLPTPDPSPQSPSADQHDVEAPLVTLQLPSPPEQPPSAAQAVPAGDSGSTTSKGTVDSNRTVSPHSIKLEAGSRTRPWPGGERSLLESRPRSPLCQSFLAREYAAENPANRQTVEGASRDIEPSDYFSAYPPQRSPLKMAHSPNRQAYAPAQSQPQPKKRRIWVKRPGASATLVAIFEDDIVDDARDMILRKYANSLGKSFDSPDVTLRIHPRSDRHSGSQRSGTAQPVAQSPLQEERVLRPDEILSRTMDVYFPGGQSVEEALLIDVPQPVPRSRRTPRHSPGLLTSHHGAYAVHYEDHRPTESDKDYFPPVLAHSPGVVTQLPVFGPGNQPHSIAVINGVPLPGVPSPGGTDRGMGPVPGGARRRNTNRPSYGRHNTSSPTIVQSSHPHGSEPRPNIATATTQVPPPPLGTPPQPASSMNIGRTNTPPPARGSSPRPTKPRRAAKKQPSNSGPNSGPTGLIASVPPINVLVVEDNIINLKLLEAFLKRLKVRYQSAMNGRDAVKKWRNGGFHLVLMDIQLPLMNGLDATKEIRRLEKVNDVGAFVKSAEEERAERGRQTMEAALGKTADPPEPLDEAKEKEKNKLGNRELFKSPVIIVALTASSLHSDRSEALAAGCNDFLTKPVNLVWLESKLKEWGCMQALIDFDGWKQWKDFSQTASPSTAPKAGKRAISNLSAAQVKSQASIKPVPPVTASSTNPTAAASGVSAPPAPKPATIGLQELGARTESQESTTTLDSTTSDDSLETAMPSRYGPSVNVQRPTPRQSVEGAAMPRIDTGSRNSSMSPKLRSAESPRSMNSMSDSGVDDRDRSSERRRRGNRGSLGGLTAVPERDGEEGRNDAEVQVGA